MTVSLQDPVNKSSSGLLVTRMGPFHVAFDLKFVSRLAIFSRVIEPPKDCDGFYFGQINVQHKPLALVGLHRKLGIPATHSEAGQAVIVNFFEDNQVALKIDDVIELNTVRAPLLLPIPPGIMTLDPKFFRGWIQIGEIGAFLINTEKMFDEADVEALCAYLY